jgi:hypothetical protein
MVNGARKVDKSGGRYTIIRRFETHDSAEGGGSCH